MKQLGLIIGGIVLIAILMVYIGWVFSVLWGWFVAPIFELREISIPESIGLITTAGLLGGKYRKEREENTSELICFLILSPTISLLVGYIILQFILR